MIKGEGGRKGERVKGRKGGKRVGKEGIKVRKRIYFI